MSTITSEIHDRRVEPARRRAFISAPASADTSVIRRVLQQQGIETFTPDELDLPGLPFSEVVREGIEQADFFVGIVDDAATNNNVLFELGFAQAMQKRTFVIVDTKATSPFTAAFGIPYLRTSPTNAEAITYGLQQFVASKHKSRLPPKSVAETHCIGNAADELLAKLSGIEESRNESELLRVITDAIRHAGVSVIAERSSDSRAEAARADLAVWSEDLVPWVANPLPIQVKLGLSSRADADRLFEGLQAALPSVRATWILFIYMDARPDQLSAIDRGPILATSARDFIESLRTASFGEVVRKLRNARVHGK